MLNNKDGKKYQKLLKEKEDLENNRPADVDAMRQWKYLMNKVLQELELFK